MCLLFSTAHILEMIFLEVVGLATFTWDTQRNPKENRDDHLIALMSMVGREKQGQGQSCDFFFLDMVLFSNMYGKPYCWCMLADTRVLVMCHHASPRIRCWGFPLHLHWKEDDILSMFYNQVVTQNHAIITSFQDVPADKREKLFYLKKKKKDGVSHNHSMYVFHTMDSMYCFKRLIFFSILSKWKELKTGEIAVLKERLLWFMSSSKCSDFQPHSKLSHWNNYVYPGICKGLAASVQNCTSHWSSAALPS